MFVRTILRSVGVVGALLVVASSGCSSSDEPQTSASSSSGGPGSTAGGTTPAATFALTSSAFDDGGPIPAEFTCDGANQSPPLSWTEPPDGTALLALVMDDPDAPTPEPFVHWVVVGIDPAIDGMGAGEVVGIQATGSGYFGPCPPAGPAHTYHFRLYALDDPDLAAFPFDADSSAKLADGALGIAELSGTYQRAD